MLSKINNILKWIGIAVIVVGIIFWIVKGCNRPVVQPQLNTHKEDSLAEIINDAAKLLKKKNDTIAYLKSNYDSIHIAQIHSRIDLDNQVKKNRELKLQYELAKTHEPQTPVTSICDQLEMQLDSTEKIIDGYEWLTDSLITAGRKLSVAQDSAYTLLNSQFFNSQLETQALQTDVMNLVKANNKLNRKAKLNSVLEKIGSIALGVLAVFAIIKK